MSARKGRRISRRRARSTFASPGRSPHKRSTPDCTVRTRRGVVAKQPPRDANRSIRVSDRLADATWTACLAAALLGTTVAVILSGLTLAFRFGLRSNLAIEPFAPSRAMVVGAGLLALAMGVRVPQRIAIWAGMFARRRFVRDEKTRNASDAAIHPGAPERKLYWTAFSLVSLSAGVSVALLPVWVPLALRAYGLMHVHFVWSQVPLSILNLAISFVAGLVPLALLGLALSCAHHLCCSHGQWDTRATAWALVGAGPGVWLVGRFAVSSGGAQPMLIGAAIPPLLLAIGAAWLGSNSDSRVAADARSPADPLPTCSDRWPTLLRSSIVAVGGGSVCAITVAALWLSPGRAVALNILAPLLLATGTGIAVGARPRGSNVRTIGAFGMCCALAGVVVGFVTYVLSMGAAARLWLAVPLAMCGAASIGYATSYGRTVLLARVARRSSAGARMLTRQLICAAATITFAAPLAVYFFREPATLMLLSMSLIALGGLLIIYEPSYTPGVRRARLKAVYGLVAAMILLASVAAVSRIPPTPVELGSDAETAATPSSPVAAHEITQNDR